MVQQTAGEGRGLPLDFDFPFAPSPFAPQVRFSVRLTHARTHTHILYYTPSSWHPCRRRTHVRRQASARFFTVTRQIILGCGQCFDSVAGVSFMYSCQRTFLNCILEVWSAPPGGPHRLSTSLDADAIARIFFSDAPLY
jgi:hypothetical protein